MVREMQMMMMMMNMRGDLLVSILGLGLQKLPTGSFRKMLLEFGNDLNVR